MIIQYKPKIIMTLAVAALVTTGFSCFFFFRIDNIVNVDLYNFGLTFSNNWANKYWENSQLYLYSASLIAILFSSSILFFLFFHRNQKKIIWRSICTLLLAMGAGLSILNIYIFFQITSIVNLDLYAYGLTFNAQWYGNYSPTFAIMVVLTIFSGLTAIAAAALLYSSTEKTKLARAKLLDSTLIAAGTAALAFSIIYSSSILALIGLSLLFWGVIITFISTDKYVKKDLFDTVVYAQQTMLNQMLEKLDYTGNALYLPPHFFNSNKIYKAYIPQNRLEELPTPEMMPKKEYDLIEFVAIPPAVLISPPGSELVPLFEAAFEKDLSQIDLQSLQQKLPELAIETLEVTQYLDIEIENENVLVKTKGSYLSIPNAEIELPSLYAHFGSQLNGAIACILAKVTGKPVIRVNSRTDVENNSEITQYRILRY
jgi:hypothetical protein